jgi:hypothetical protein
MNSHFYLSITQHSTNPNEHLSTWTFLLSFEEGEERRIRNLDDLEANSWDISDGVTAPAESRDQDLVILLDEVQATVLWHERGDLLGVLDQLHADAFADGRVRLLSFDAPETKVN